jgi:hypothetical protein
MAAQVSSLSDRRSYQRHSMRTRQVRKSRTRRIKALARQASFLLKRNRQVGITLCEPGSSSYPIGGFNNLCFRRQCSNARFEFQGSNGSLIPAGLRVLSSDQEFTDILYDPNTEELTIDRGNSTLIPGCELLVVLCLGWIDPNLYDSARLNYHRNGQAEAV